MEPIYVALLGVFFGVLYRTVNPYLKKRREAREKGESLPFDLDYLITALEALVTAAAITIFIFPGLQIETAQAMIYVFCNGFAYGFTANHMLNESI